MPMEAMTLPEAMSEIEAVLTRLLAAHDVPVDNLSIKEYQTTKLHSCESYARVPSNISSSPAAALSSSCGEQRAPPNQSESLPSIEPLPGRLPAQQRSVSFVEEGAQNIVFSPHLDDTKSEASMVSPLFEMHNVWRRLGEEQVSKAARCASSLPSDTLDLSSENVSQQLGIASVWATGAMVSLFANATFLPLVAFQPPGISVDAIIVATALFWTLTFPVAMIRWMEMPSPRAALVGLQELLLTALLFIDSWPNE
ncbi:unnamed protein product [Symbiodinium natans]|uniref:Uncharacterized protein n=1 Tax=Symbiodinium natans TaxID=878477 RepID=A0A812UC67_9DINO|nr:unnamed protein product [Symbiodinium natans]